METSALQQLAWNIEGVVNKGTESHSPSPCLRWRSQPMSNDDVQAFESTETFELYMGKESPFAENQNGVGKESADGTESNFRMLSPKRHLNNIKFFIHQQCGKMFDPDLVDVFFNKEDEFLAVCERYCD